MPIDRSFSYNIGIPKEKVCFGFTSQREQQDPTMPICPPKLLNRPTGNFDTHRKWGAGETAFEKSRKCSAEIAALERLGKNPHILIMGKIP